MARYSTLSYDRSFGQAMSYETLRTIMSGFAMLKNTRAIRALTPHIARA